MGAPAAADPDYLVTSTDMKVGVYTIVTGHGTLDVPRNVTVTLTRQETVDTLGTITVTGTDINGAALTEVITPLDNTTAYGTKAFKTVTKIEGTGWAVNSGTPDPDLITVGFGDSLGLPVLLSRDSVIRAFLGGNKESAHPTVAAGATTLAASTIKLNSALNGTAVIVDYYET